MHIIYKAQNKLMQPPLPLQITLENREGGIAQWLERRTHDWKVPGSNPCRSGRKIFFSMVDFLCRL